MRCFFVFLCLLQSLDVHADLVAEFDRISDEPREVEYTNNLDLDLRGGHLQGIQQVGDDFVLSGSSASASYMIVIDGTSGAASYYPRRPKPFKHAGGFQVSDGIGVVGIEDNRARNASYVDMFALTEAGAFDRENGRSVATITRRGARERTTAGAVGVAVTESGPLLVVADWDSRHLDFYRTSEPDIELQTGLSWSVETTAIRLPREEGESYERFAVLAAEHLDRIGWVDARWHSYQNVNLFEDEGALYLLATATSGGDNIADLYRVVRAGDRISGLEKVASRVFKLPDWAKFRWGAGFWRRADGALVLGVTGEHLERAGKLLVFEPR